MPTEIDKIDDSWTKVDKVPSKKKLLLKARKLSLKREKEKAAKRYPPFGDEDVSKCKVLTLHPVQKKSQELRPNLQEIQRILKASASRRIRLEPRSKAVQAMTRKSCAGVQAGPGRPTLSKTSGVQTLKRVSASANTQTQDDEKDRTIRLLQRRIDHLEAARKVDQNTSWQLRSEMRQGIRENERMNLQLSQMKESLERKDRRIAKLEEALDQNDIAIEVVQPGQMTVAARLKQVEATVKHMGPTRSQEVQDIWKRLEDLQKLDLQSLQERISGIEEDQEKMAWNLKQEMGNAVEEIDSRCKDLEDEVYVKDKDRRQEEANTTWQMHKELLNMQHKLSTHLREFDQTVRPMSKRLHSIEKTQLVGDISWAPAGEATNWPSDAPRWDKPKGMPRYPWEEPREEDDEIENSDDEKGPKVKTTLTITEKEVSEEINYFPQGYRPIPVDDDEVHEMW